MNAPTPLLEVTDAGLKIENRWLWRQLDLRLSPGCFLAVTGPSGAGKTSLLRCLAGQIPLSEGTITGKETSIAMIHQDLQLADGATSLMNALGGCLWRHSFWSTFFSFPTKERTEARRLLEQFGLSGKENQWASTLSRGERQRLAICRTLLARPHILLADEPVASLDSTWGDRVLGHLKETSQDRNGCIICSLHDESQVTRFADFRLHLDESTPEGWKLQSVRKDKTS